MILEVEARAHVFLPGVTEDERFPAALSRNCAPQLAMHLCGLLESSMSEWVFHDFYCPECVTDAAPRSEVHLYD